MPGVDLYNNNNDLANPHRASIAKLTMLPEHHIPAASQTGLTNAS